MGSSGVCTDLGKLEEEPVKERQESCLDIQVEGVLESSQGKRQRGPFKSGGGHLEDRNSRWKGGLLTFLAIAIKFILIEGFVHFKEFFIYTYKECSVLALLWALSWERRLCWLLVRGGPRSMGSGREKIWVSTAPCPEHPVSFWGDWG